MPADGRMQADGPKRSKRHVNGPARLDRFVEPLLDPIVSKAGFGSAAILAQWRDIVGGELGLRTRPEKIVWPRQGEEQPKPATLVVRAEGGDALEIQHMTREIVDRINAFFGWPAVGKVKVRQAPVARASAPAENPPQEPDRPAPPADLSGIDDPELREALERLGRRVKSDTSA